MVQSGVYDEQTERAVAAFQAYSGLAATGVTDEATWSTLYSQYTAIDGDVFENRALFPYSRDADAVPAAALSPAETRFADTTRFVQFPGVTLKEGMRDKEANT